MEAPSGGEEARRPTSRSTFPRNATVTVAVASVVLTLGTTLRGIRADAHAYLGSTAAERDHTLTDALGFSSEGWDFIHDHVKRGDRYVLIVLRDLRGTPGAHDMSSYAGYRLMPAIAAREPAKANVGVYVGAPAPPAARCVDRTMTACVLRRRS